MGCPCCADRKDLPEFRTLTAKAIDAPEFRRDLWSNSEFSTASTRYPSSSDGFPASPRSSTSEDRSLSPSRDSPKVVDGLVLEFEMSNGLNKEVVMTQRPLGMKTSAADPLTVVDVQPQGHA